MSKSLAEKFAEERGLPEQVIPILERHLGAINPPEFPGMGVGPEEAERARQEVEGPRGSTVPMVGEAALIGAPAGVGAATARAAGPALRQLATKAGLQKIPGAVTEGMKAGARSALPAGASEYLGGEAYRATAESDLPEPYRTGIATTAPFLVDLLTPGPGRARAPEPRRLPEPQKRLPAPEVQQATPDVEITPKTDDELVDLAKRFGMDEKIRRIDQDLELDLEKMVQDLEAKGQGIDFGDVTFQGDDIRRLARRVRQPRSPTEGLEKPIYEMEPDELQRLEQTQKAYEARGAEDVFGPEGAKEYERLQRIANSGTLPRDQVDEAAKALGRMEEGLTPAQERRLFGFGEEGPGYEEIRGLRRAVESVDVDDEEAMGESLRYALTKIGKETDPAKMGPSEREAYAQLRYAMNEAQRRGLDTEKISQAALRGAARRFSDPQDAEFMLRRFIKKPGKRPARRAEPRQIAGPEKATFNDLLQRQNEADLEEALRLQPRSRKIRERKGAADAALRKLRREKIQPGDRVMTQKGEGVVTSWVPVRGMRPKLPEERVHQVEGESIYEATGRTPGNLYVEIGGKKQVFPARKVVRLKETAQEAE